MRCVFCDFSDTNVKDSRPSEEGNFIRRRRQCPSCGGRFKTTERVEFRAIKVIKKNGMVRDFDSNKLLKSITVAARKRNISNEAIDKIVHNIIAKIDQYGEGEIYSKTIGELVMLELAKIDHVAYIRYASVYKDFSKPSDFANFIKQLTDEEKKYA